MGTCIARAVGSAACGNSTPSGFSYCEEHKDRRGAIKERVQEEEKKARTIVSIPPSQAPVEDQGYKAPSTKGIEKQINETLRHSPAQELTPEALLQEVVDMVHKVVKFEELAWEKVEALGDDGWRYRDKTGEQVRGEVQIYERALDRSSRVLANITKLGIDAQLQNASSAQLEAVRNVVMETLMALDLGPDQLKFARETMAEKFSKLGRSA